MKHLLDDRQAGIGGQLHEGVVDEVAGLVAHRADRGVLDEGAPGTGPLFGVGRRSSPSVHVHAELLRGDALSYRSYRSFLIHTLLPWS